ncbi:alpha/beta fold hydrolase [Mucilaginibacter sp. HD30]
MKKINESVFTEHYVKITEGKIIYAREYARNGPTMFLLHGFPDNIHLYDYLVPELTEKFHIIIFDFLGWHNSSKPRDYGYTAHDQKKELVAVIGYFRAENIWLVAHDASGPPAINYALDQPENVEQLILLNTYYSRMPTTRKPEAIWMFSTPVVRVVTGWVARNFSFINRLTYYNQVGKFIKNKERRKALVPLLYRSFSQPENFRSFLALNRDLDSAVRANTLRVPEMWKLNNKVHIIFGDADPYLNAGVACSFNNIMPGSTLTLISDAGHYVQVDNPEQIALVLTDLLK